MKKKLPKNFGQMKAEPKLTKYALRKMFQSWLDTDMVKAGYNFNIVEAKNEAFARGYRFALYSVINKIQSNE